MSKVLSISKFVVKKAYAKLLFVYYSVLGRKVECNICNYKAGKLISDKWHLYSKCPDCGSDVRHRLLWAALTFLNDFSFDKLIKEKKILHFAPEKLLEKRLKKLTLTYKTADFFTEGYSYGKIDYNLDISNMKHIPDQTFDCVIACDVLEHVIRHKEGMKEVYRVLSNNGYCIFTVPQKDNLKETYEDFSITDVKERETIFGQYDHLRIYGVDFTTMLKDAGFLVTAINESFFEKEIIEKYVLVPPILSKNPLATNYRSIFFGQKLIKSK